MDYVVNDKYSDNDDDGDNIYDEYDEYNVGDNNT